MLALVFAIAMGGSRLVGLLPPMISAVVLVLALGGHPELHPGQARSRASRPRSSCSSPSRAAATGTCCRWWSCCSRSAACWSWPPARRSSRPSSTRSSEHAGPLQGSASGTVNDTPQRTGFKGFLRENWLYIVGALRADPAGPDPAGLLRRGRRLGLHLQHLLSRGPQSGSPVSTQAAQSRVVYFGLPDSSFIARSFFFASHRACHLGSFSIHRRR